MKKFHPKKLTCVAVFNFVALKGTDFRGLVCSCSEGLNARPAEKINIVLHN